MIIADSFCWSLGVGQRGGGDYHRPMLEDMTTTQSLALFLRALQGQNYSTKTVRAYGDDLAQFLGWVEKNRVDFDIPTRLSRADIEGFMQFLAAGDSSALNRGHEPQRSMRRWNARDGRPRRFGGAQRG